MPICDVCSNEHPKAGQTYNGKPLCQGCIDYMSGKHLKREGSKKDG